MRQAGNTAPPAEAAPGFDALAGHIRGWAVADASDLKTGVKYNGQIRLRLDTSLLATPFQVNALNSSSWSLATPWADFDFAISAGGAIADDEVISEPVGHLAHAPVVVLEGLGIALAGAAVVHDDVAPAMRSDRT